MTCKCDYNQYLARIRLQNMDEKYQINMQIVIFIVMFFTAREIPYIKWRVA